MSESESLPPLVLRNDGGPAFPRPQNIGTTATAQDGMSLRDWFATFAPEPSQADITNEVEGDRLRNPHGDTYKPPRRGVVEIKAELRYRYADAMLKARQS